MTKEKGFTFTKFTRNGEYGLHLASTQFYVNHNTPMDEYRYYADEEKRQEDIIDLIEWVELGFWDDRSYEIINCGEAEF